MIQQTIKNLVLLFLALVLIFFIVIIAFLFWPHYIYLKEVEQISINGNLEDFISEFNNEQLSWWRRLGPEEDQKFLEDELDFEFPEILNSSEDYYISGGRKILSIKYTVFDRISHDYSWEKNIYTATGVLSKEWYPNTLFIYKGDGKIYIHPLESNTKLE